MKALFITICLVVLLGCCVSCTTASYNPKTGEVKYSQWLSEKELVDVLIEAVPGGGWHVEIGSSKTNTDKANEAISTLANAVVALSATK